MLSLSYVRVEGEQESEAEVSSLFGYFDGIAIGGFLFRPLLFLWNQFILKKFQKSRCLRAVHVLAGRAFCFPRSSSSLDSSPLEFGKSISSDSSNEQSLSGCASSVASATSLSEMSAFPDCSYYMLAERTHVQIRLDLVVLY